MAYLVIRIANEAGGRVATQCVELGRPLCSLGIDRQLSRPVGRAYRGHKRYGELRHHERKLTRDALINELGGNWIAACGLRDGGNACLLGGFIKQDAHEDHVPATGGFLELYLHGLSHHARFWTNWHKEPSASVAEHAAQYEDLGSSVAFLTLGHAILVRAWAL